MNTRTRTTAAVAALIVAVGAGYGVARLTAAPPAGAAAESEEGHAEEGEGGEPGVVILTPAEAQAAGIRIISVQSGGGGETRLSGRVEQAVIDEFVQRELDTADADGIGLAHDRWPGDGLDSHGFFKRCMHGSLDRLRSKRRG